jgi:hypothetical protein
LRGRLESESDDAVLLRFEVQDTGLGLAITKRLVESKTWTIRKSMPGRN